MASPCDLPIVKQACAAKDAAGAVKEAVNFAQDPMGYIAQKLQDAADGLATSVLPALEKVTHPDLSLDWFIGAYRISFALAVFVWVVFLGWNFVQLARRRISGDTLVESLVYYTPTFFFAVLFGPALGTVLVRFTGALTDALVQWGVAGSVQETTTTLEAAIKAGDSGKIAGGSVVAIITFGALILALCTVFLVLLVMLVTQYLAGAVFPLSAVWLVHPRQRGRGLRIALVFLGLNGAHVLIFLMLGVAFRMIGGLGADFDDSGLQIAANLFVAVIALVLAVMTPFGLLAFAPVGASTAPVNDPFSAPMGGGGGYVGGGYADSAEDSQAAQMARDDALFSSDDADHDPASDSGSGASSGAVSGAPGGGSGRQLIGAGAGRGARGLSATAMEGADSSGSGSTTSSSSGGSGGASRGSGAGGAGDAAGIAAAAAAGGGAAAAAEAGGAGGAGAEGGAGGGAGGVGAAAVGAVSAVVEAAQAAGETAMEQMDHAYEDGDGYDGRNGDQYRGGGR